MRSVELDDNHRALFLLVELVGSLVVDVGEVRLSFDDSGRLLVDFLVELDPRVEDDQHVRELVVLDLSFRSEALVELSCSKITWCIDECSFRVEVEHRCIPSARSFGVRPELEQEIVVD